MVDAIGPIFAAGFQHITKSGYELLFLPDVHNDELQAAGKAPVYYWLPNTVRLARKENNDFVFSFINFTGQHSSSSPQGGAGESQDVLGGLIGFSTTTAPPPEVLQQAQDDLLNIFRGSSDKFWGWRNAVAPMFRPVPIVSNITSVTNLAPTADGSVPTTGTTSGTGAPAAGGAAGGGAAAGGAAAGGAAGAGAGGAAGGPPTRSRALASRPPAVGTTRQVPAMRTGPVPLVRDVGGSVSPWYFKLQGQGDGSVSPFAENAYSGLVGEYPAALIWSSFHAGTTPITVWQHLALKVWSPQIHLVVDGDWDRIQDHFSAAAHGGGLWWSADIQAQFNDLRESGGITVRLEVDASLPNADQLTQDLQKRSDLVFQKFMDQAQKVIFDPAPFNEKPAEAPSGFLGFGGGVAFKFREDRTHLHLHYEETRELGYLQPYPISGQLEGLYDELKSNPDAEHKYFTQLYLDDWDQKVTRQVKPVVNWPDASRQWAGEPVAFLSAQIGYPRTDGTLEWDSALFSRTDPLDYWTVTRSQKRAEDVTNAPAGWTPDKTFVKRQVHFTEPPDDTQFPFVRMAVERNVVELDPGDTGTLSDEMNLEVRVDNVGALAVGPISLSAELTDNTQVVDVTFTPRGNNLDGNPRTPVTFRWSNNDQEQPRFWYIFTGDPAYAPSFDYVVSVTVKGSLFTKGMQWTGPSQTGASNGPLMVSVPTPSDPGVTTKDIPFHTVATIPVQVPVGGTPPSTTHASSGPPHTSRSSAPPVRRSAPPATIVLPDDAPAVTYSGYRLMPPTASARAGSGTTGSSAADPRGTGANGETATGYHR